MYDSAPEREMIPIEKTMQKEQTSQNAVAPLADIINVRIQTTMGEMEVELYGSKTPKTVQNFLDLINKGFYDGLVFHRVIPKFMIQTGCPFGTGFGGPGYKFEDEFVADLKHSQAGILSMANSGPNSNGSQFFISVAATPWLDGRHTVFGKVTKGLDVAKAISEVPRDSRDKPTSPVMMNKVEVLS